MFKSVSLIESPTKWIRKMITIQNIRNIEVMQARLLERIYRESRHHQVRQRAHGLLLIHRGIQCN